MRLFVAVLLISIIVHIGILLIPLPEKEMKKNEVVPVSIIDIKKEEVKKKSATKPKKIVKQKNIPVEKKEVVKKDTKKQENVKKPDVQKQASLDKNIKKDDVKNKSDNTQQKSQTKPNEEPNKTKVEEKPFRPKGADDPLVLPDINVPLTNNMDIPEVKLPDISKPNITNDMVENQRNVDIAKELASLKGSDGGASSNNKQEISNQVKQEAASKSENLSSKSNLYNFDIAPSGNRKVVHVPEDPVFALANDTYVTIKFHIDKQGNTHSISFVTRSSSEVEKLAYEYVNGMKFDAIIEDRDDFAQITMFFKVQK